MSIKVDGVASDEAKSLAVEEERLFRQGLDALQRYYAAPDGAAGDAQRKAADAALKSTAKSASDVRSRRAGIEGNIEEAQRFAHDFLEWIAALKT